MKFFPFWSRAMLRKFLYDCYYKNMTTVTEIMSIIIITCLIILPLVSLLEAAQTTGMVTPVLASLSPWFFSWDTHARACLESREWLLMTVGFLSLPSTQDLPFTSTNYKSTYLHDNLKIGTFLQTLRTKITRKSLICTRSCICLPLSSPRLRCLSYFFPYFLIFINDTWLPGFFFFYVFFFTTSLLSLVTYLQESCSLNPGPNIW